MKFVTYATLFAAMLTVGPAATAQAQETKALAKKKP
jgi:hypothetical protein